MYSLQLEHELLTQYKLQFDVMLIEETFFLWPANLKRKQMRVESTLFHTRERSCFPISEELPSSSPQTAFDCDAFFNPEKLLRLSQKKDYVSLLQYLFSTRACLEEDASN